MYKTYIISTFLSESISSRGHTQIPYLTAQLRNVKDCLTISSVLEVLGKMGGWHGRVMELGVICPYRENTHRSMNMAAKELYHYLHVFAQ